LNQLLPHVLLAVSPRPPFYFPVLPSLHSTILFVQILLLIIIPCIKLFGLVAVGRRGQEGNTNLSRKKEASGAVIPPFMGHLSTALVYLQHYVEHDGCCNPVSVLSLPGDGLRAAICPLLPRIHETCTKEGPNGQWRGRTDHILGPILTIRFYGQGAAALMT
jgi:hypothetical protein